MATFTCQICFEQQQARLPLGRLATGNGDVLRADDCQHPICQACLATWVSTRVQEQFAFNIRCPFVGCANKLFEQDIDRLREIGALDPQIFETFVELRTRDYTERAKGLSQNLKEVLESERDFDVIQGLWHSMRLCPRCSLAIERSEGCNSFYCICGHHFDFATAPRIFGNNIKNYSKVIDAAKSLCMSLQDAEKYGGDAVDGKKWSSLRAIAAYKAVTRISNEAKITMDEAFELYMQAKSGDEDAQSRIRATRGRMNSTMQSEDEDEEEEMPFVLIWESTAEAAPKEMQNMAWVAAEIDIDEAKRNATDDVAQEEAAVVSEVPAPQDLFEPWNAREQNEQVGYTHYSCQTTLEEMTMWKQAIVLRRSCSQP